MSKTVDDLVEKVAREIVESMGDTPESAARAAIAAVAEWLDAWHKAEYLQKENHASPALRSALEAKP